MPLICGEAWLDNWYDFVDFAATEEAAAEARTVWEFLGKIKINYLSKKKEGLFVPPLAKKLK